MNQENKAKGKASAKRYTEEFRRSVVDHWQSSGKTAKEVAQEFGVNFWNLRDWKRQYGSGLDRWTRRCRRVLRSWRERTSAYAGSWPG